MKYAMLSVLALAACGGTDVPDACAKYAGQTCISLEISAGSDVTSKKLDQLSYTSSTGLDFGAADLRSPSTPLATPLELPFVEPLLPGPSFVGGSFSFELTGYVAGSPIGNANVDGAVASGQHLRLPVVLEREGNPDGSAAADGFDSDGGADGGHDIGPVAPRLISPMPMTHVTKKRPTLHWVLAPDTDGAHVEICTTRACTSVVTTIEATGSSGVPELDLPTGHTLFWRVYGKAGSTVGEVPSPTWELTPSVFDTAIDSSWGNFLDLDGDGLADLAVGEPGTGKVFVYYGKSGWPATIPGGPDATITNTTFADFGNRTASAGDVDGDGFGDLLVGACAGGQAPVKSCAGGGVFLYRGGPSGVSTTPASQLVGMNLGYAIDGAGDLDGDGYADLVAGAPLTPKAYVYRGSATPPAMLSAAWTLASPMGALGSDYGVSVAGLGDIDGDGHPELAVAASTDTNNGQVYIYAKGFTPGTTPPVTYKGVLNITSTTYTNIATTSGLVASAGDLNGDGTADYLVSLTVTQTSGNGNGASGPVYAYLGAASSFSTFQDPITLGTAGTGNEAVGKAAAGGDLDGDGYSDPVISAPSSPTLSTTVTESSGVVSIWLSNNAPFLMNTKPTAAASVTIAPTPAQTGHLLFGWTLAVADFNGDGKSEVYTTAPLLDAGEGAAYLFEQDGLHDFLTNPPPFIVGQDPGAGFGY